MHIDLSWLPVVFVAVCMVGANRADAHAKRERKRWR